jgi:adenylate cyclase
MIGRCRHLQLCQGWGRLSDNDIGEAVWLARQAIQTGKDDSETLSIAAFTLSIFAGEHLTAKSIAERALKLNENSVHAWVTNGWVSAFLDQPAVAVESFRQAMRLSPLDPLTFLFAAGFSFACAVARRYDDAIAWADRSLQEQPEFVIAIRLKAALCAYVGRIEEARDCLSRLLERQPDLTIASYRRSAQLWFSAKFLDWYLENLRKAGLPEDNRDLRSALQRDREGSRLAQRAPASRHQDQHRRHGEDECVKCGGGSAIDNSVAAAE